MEKYAAMVKNSLSIYSGPQSKIGRNSSYLVKTGRQVLKDCSEPTTQIQSQHLATNSISNLEQQSFIAKELLQFESKLEPTQRGKYKGFSKKARQISMMLGSTEGYRQYKKQIHKFNENTNKQNDQPLLKENLRKNICDVPKNNNGNFNSFLTKRKCDKGIDAFRKF